MNYIEINLNSMAKLQKFLEITNKYTSNNVVEVWNKNETRVYSANSVVSIFCLNFEKPIVTGIFANEVVSKRFYEEMGEFINE